MAAVPPKYSQSRYENYQVFEILIPKHSLILPTRFVVKNDLVEDYTEQDLKEFVLQLGSIGAAEKVCYGFGCCLHVQRDKGQWTMCQGYWPDLWKNLSKIEECSGNTIPITSLLPGTCTMIESPTHSTVLVEFKGETFIAKLPEDGKSADKMMQEVKTLRSLQHDSIISLPRFLVRDSNRIVAFLLKYYPNGNLRDYMSKLRYKGPLHPDLFRKWFFQYTRALRYLHEQEVDYQNIKPKNCVVNDNKNLILINFTSKACYIKYGRASEVFRRNTVRKAEDGIGINYRPHPFQYHIDQGSSLPGLYAPLHWPKNAREKAAVFSLARVFWIVSECVPSNKFPERDGSGFLYSTIFTDASANLPQQWKDLILRCVELNPNERPSLGEIVTFLEDKNEPIA